MKKQNGTDFLYVQYVIKPLEALIQEISMLGLSSSDEVRALDKLLLEKYIVLEKMLQDKS